jgi:hypothetical protein
MEDQLPQKKRIKRRSGNKLDRGEISIVKATISILNYQDQGILSHFTRQTRKINQAFGFKGGG